MLPASKANLARIRNNQRRSRARRKEYLQELEARLRQYELRGIETSVDIQMAARKVADENRKLRGLLLVHGIEDDSVEAYLQSSPTVDALFASQFPSRSAPVQVPHHLLQKRKSFCSDGVIGVPMNGMGGPKGGGKSPTSVSTTQSPWDSNRLSNPWALQHIGKSTLHQSMAPSCTTRSTSSTSHHPHHNAPELQELAPVQLSRNPSPVFMVNHSQMFDLDTQLSQLNPPPYITYQLIPQHL